MSERKIKMLSIMAVEVKKIKTLIDSMRIERKRGRERESR